MQLCYMAVDQRLACEHLKINSKGSTDRLSFLQRCKEGKEFFVDGIVSSFPNDKVSKKEFKEAVQEKFLRTYLIRKYIIEEEEKRSRLPYGEI